MFRVERLRVEAQLKSGRENLVEGLSFSIERGQRLAIVGESGCGKTMTAMAIMGLLPENCRAQGKILLAGTDLLELTDRERERIRGRKLVLIPQSGAEFLNPVLTVRAQIFETLRRLKLRRRSALETRARELLSRAGFEDPGAVLKLYPFQLSGGMAQRVVLAIGLASDPELVIADEPTRGIDDETAAGFIDQMNALFSGAAVVLITHNISVAETCEKIMVMYRGRVMEYGETARVLNDPQSEYTRCLIAALPKNGLIAAQNRDFLSKEAAIC